MFCKECGAEIRDTAIMCVSCGSPTKSGSTEVSKSLLVWGWITAVMMPVVGLILGIIVTVKKNWAHGIGMIVASIFFWNFWLGFMSGFMGY